MDFAGDRVTITGVFLPTPYTGFRALRAGFFLFFFFMGYFVFLTNLNNQVLLPIPIWMFAILFDTSKATPMFVGKRKGFTIFANIQLFQYDLTPEMEDNIRKKSQGNFLFPFDQLFSLLIDC